jgi:hypothetical protein
LDIARHPNLGHHFLLHAGFPEQDYCLAVERAEAALARPSPSADMPEHQNEGEFVAAEITRRVTLSKKDRLYVERHKRSMLRAALA